MNEVVMTHYGDSDTTGTAYRTYSPVAAGKRLAGTSQPGDIRKGPHFLHSVKMVQTTNNQVAPGFEPVFLAIYYEVSSDDIRH